jgi:L-threonylcarbamoyladenylate synthase
VDTRVLQVDPQHPDAAAIDQAAAVVRSGGLVAFPTETVYGLGANALDEQAVKRIFEAKGRPARNPIIVHIDQVDAARPLITDWPDVAARLAERFWPGPLTLVLPRSDRVPDIVTAGGDTVAIRVPAHPVALALLRASGLPLAAPSANRSNRLSPTLASHVLHHLQGAIELVLDAGPTSGGLESTVLDVTTTAPRLLRPGLVTRSQIEALIGPIDLGSVSATLRSPGMLGRHYAPQTPLECVRDGRKRVEELLAAGQRIGWLTLQSDLYAGSDSAIIIAMPIDPAAYSARLYAELHRLDEAGLDRIVVDSPPETSDWLAVHDRLRRASQV